MNAKTPRDWARLLKDEWEERARSVSRDFFIASHPGWNVKEEWDRQAATDAATMTFAIERPALAAMDVLEIGCGVGRLVPYLAPFGASYTGIDLAATLVEEARRRNREHGNARFFENDGLTLPAAARDRAYGLIFANAVFIHCPLEVIRSLVSEALTALAPRGELRFQLRADPDDLEGIFSMPGAESAHDTIRTMETAPIADRHLADERHYAGALFTYAEALRFVRSLGDERADLLRLDRTLIYGRIFAPR